MRKTLAPLFVPFVLCALISCSKVENKPVAEKPASPAVQAQTASIDLPTAKCENCEKTIHDAVEKVDGVTGVTVDAKAHTAKVQYIAARTNVGALETAISKAGYTANKTTRDAKSYEKLDECCK